MELMNQEHFIEPILTPEKVWIVPVGPGHVIISNLFPLVCNMPY